MITDELTNYQNNLEDSINHVLNRIENDMKFYHELEVELYENGKIKKINIKPNIPLLISLGLVGTIIGVTTIYYIGPDNVMSIIQAIAISKGLTNFEIKKIN